MSKIKFISLGLCPDYKWNILTDIYVVILNADCNYTKHRVITTPNEEL